MSQIQPAGCAVETVCETIGLSSLWYGTCTASAVSTNSTCLRLLNGTP